MKSPSVLVHCALLGIVVPSAQNTGGKRNTDEDTVHDTKNFP